MRSLRTPEMVAREIASLSIRSQECAARNDAEAAWQLLADAHVLSQAWPWPHLRVHASMLSLAWRTRDRREVLGQLFRLGVAFPASAVGRYPSGNSGRANVSAFQSATIRPELAELLTQADLPGSSPPR